MLETVKYLMENHYDFVVGVSVGIGMLILILIDDMKKKGFYDKK